MDEETPAIPVEPETPEVKDTVTISGPLPEITVIPDITEDAGNVTINSNEASTLIFPNPTKGSVSIELKPAEAQDIVIYLYDARYRRLTEIFVPASECRVQQQLDLSAYSCGTYYIKIEGRSFSASGKIVKN